MANVKQTTIRAEFSGTIATGAFENEKPLFVVEEVFDGPLTEVEKQTAQAIAYALCREAFTVVQRRSQEQKVKIEAEGIRLYPVADLKKSYPSVTSITGWDTEWHLPELQLNQYASRGTIIHKRCEHFDLTGEWLSIKALVDRYAELYKDLIIVKKGDLKLEIEEGFDYPAFLQKYPIKHVDSECVVYNHEYEYAGRLDKRGYVLPSKEWKALGAIEGVLTIFDFKTGTVDAFKHGQQLTAYAKCPENKDVKQLVIIPLTAKTQQGYSKPLVITDINKFWNAFLDNRSAFKKRYGI